jgi:hypothetical protein
LIWPLGSLGLLHLTPKLFSLLNKNYKSFVLFQKQNITVNIIILNFYDNRKGSYCLYIVGFRDRTDQYGQGAKASYASST